MFYRFWQMFLGFLYPPHCLLCKKALPLVPGLCRACEQEAFYLAPGIHTDFRVNGVQTFILSEFNDSVRQLIHMLKYQGQSLVGRLLGQALGRYLIENMNVTEDLVVVPVPLHAARKRERGYNQGALLAQGVGQVLNQPVHDHVLKRLRHTPSQTHLGRQARQENVAEAFCVCQIEAIRGKVVLLIDDVITTGATAGACVSVLQAAGAEKVVVGAIARPSMGEDR